MWRQLARAYPGEGQGLLSVVYSEELSFAPEELR